MLLDLQTLPKPIPFNEIFERAAPLEIEIGSGKGRYLRERAAAYPTHNFLGLEKSIKWLRYSINRFERAELPNVRLIRCYAEDLLSEFVPNASVDAYHVMFPDPWPKRKHQKRRLVQNPFLEEAHRTLKPGGLIHIGTDHKDYYDAMLKLFQSLWVDRFRLERMDSNPFRSNFRDKYEREGRKLMFLLAQRI